MTNNGQTGKRRLKASDAEIAIKYKVLHPNRGDVVMVLQPKTLVDEQFDAVLQGFANSLYQNAGYPVVVIGVKKLTDIRLLNEEMMGKYGWYRQQIDTSVLDEFLAKVDEEE